MFAKFASTLKALITKTETCHHEAGFSSVDIEDIKRRSGFLEASHNPFAFHYSDSSHDLRI